jgi:hypothetical protein
VAYKREFFQTVLVYDENNENSEEEGLQGC